MFSLLTKSTFKRNSRIQIVRYELYVWRPCTLFWSRYDDFDDTNAVFALSVSGRLKSLLCVVKLEADESSTRAFMVTRNLLTDE